MWIEFVGGAKRTDKPSKRPFDVLAEGLPSKNTRGDKTAVELFVAGVRDWATVFWRRHRERKAKLPVTSCVPSSLRDSSACKSGLCLPTISRAAILNGGTKSPAFCPRCRFHLGG